MPRRYVYFTNNYIVIVNFRINWTLGSVRLGNRTIGVNLRKNAFNRNSLRLLHSVGATSRSRPGGRSYKKKSVGQSPPTRENLVIMLQNVPLILNVTIVDFTIYWTLSLNMDKCATVLKSRPGGRSYKKRCNELYDYCVGTAVGRIELVKPDRLELK